MKTRRRGQSLVEFAIVLPLFLSLIFGILDLGRAVWAMDVSSHAANEAARFAIVHGGSATNSYPVGPPASTAQQVIPDESHPYPSPSKQAIYDVATKAAMGSGGGASVTVCYGQGCAGDVDIPGASNARGTPVTVRVTIHVTIFTGALLGVSDVDVSSTSTMVVNH
jgi:hypothetical protein